MPTLRELVSDIENIATSGKENYSFRIDSVQIAYWVHEIRSKLISEAITKRENITDIWVQSLDCLDVYQIDKSDCCQVPTGCYILKTKIKIPNTVENFSDNCILRVTSPNGQIIAKSNPFKSKYNQYNKYTKNKSFSY